MPLLRRSPLSILYSSSRPLSSSLLKVPHFKPSSSHSSSSSSSSVSLTRSISTMTTEASVRTFFSSPSFAVVGASNNEAKYGHKVFAWYTSHSLPVLPINPSSPSITVSGTAHPTVPSLSALPDPKNTSVSIITPPKVTLSVLKEAKQLGVPSVWMQPGSFDDEVLKFAHGQGGFEAVVAGEGGRGGEGWCVLVDGERGLRAAGKL